MIQEFKPELVAPCGMDCNVCSGYLAYSRKLPKKRGKIFHCIGCRPRSKLCAFLKGRCLKLRKGKIEFCFECENIPCKALKHIDERYKTKYGMSFLENLQTIKKQGTKKFLLLEQKKWRCHKCNGTICVHNGKCYDCEHIESWKS
jgi:hypothetical protein